MHKHIFTWLLAAFFIFSFQVNAQDVVWAKNRADIQTFSSPEGFISDNAGNSYEFRTVYSSGTIQSTQLKKYDGNGNLVLTKSFNGDITTKDMMFDPATSRLFVCGFFTGSLSLNGHNLTSRGGRDGFLAEFDLFGNVLAITSFGGQRTDEAAGLYVDNSTNRIVVTGGITDSVYFNNVLTARQTQSMFVAAFTKSLVIVNAFYFDFVPGLNDSYQFSSGVEVVVRNGNTYVLHDREGIHPFDETPSPYPHTGRFIMKIHSSGSILWSYRVIGDESYYGWGSRSLKVNSAGDAFVIRTSYGKYGGTSTVLRLSNADGTVVWTYSSTALDQRYRDLEIDNSNALLILGNEAWDSCPCETSSYGYDVIKKFNSSNSLLWDKRYYDIYSQELALDHQQNIYFLGVIGKDPTVIGTYTLSESQGSGFIAKVVNGGAAPAIATGALSASSFNPGNAVSVPFIVSGSFASGNIFTAQLSDFNGSFKSPRSIGSLTGTTSGTIAAQIPFDAQPGSLYRIRVIAGNPSRYGSDNGSDIRINGTQTLIAANASWKYLDNGSNQGTAWRSLSYSDAAWKTGNAQLGYGDGDEATNVSYGPRSSNKYITTYFRKIISLSNPSQYTKFELGLLRDDGAVVYINGVEVARTNMPSGTISYTTRASSTVDGSAESAYKIYSISPSRFVNGNNVIAVEIHQASSSSSDISFALKLNGLKTTPSTDIVAANSSWKYLDSGIDPDYWISPYYDDSAWKTGNAELGYGDGDEAAKVSYGPSSSSKYITTYFRKKFEVDAAEVKGLQLELLRDDGAIVYLNGLEVFRTNMPAGTITANTLASTYVDGTYEKTWYTKSINIDYLRNGENVIAVEIHQSSASSSDISFNLRLKRSSSNPFGREVDEDNSVLQLAASERNNLDSSSFIVFPNPAVGNFTVEYFNPESRGEPVVMQVLNVAGQSICKTELQPAEGVIRTVVSINPQPEAGIYFVIINTRKGTKTRKIILASQ